MSGQARWHQNCFLGDCSRHAHQTKAATNTPAPCRHFRVFIPHANPWCKVSEAWRQRSCNASHTGAGAGQASTAPCKRHPGPQGPWRRPSHSLSPARVAGTRPWDSLQATHPDPLSPQLRLGTAAPGPWIPPQSPHLLPLRLRTQKTPRTRLPSGRGTGGLCGLSDCRASGFSSEHERK